MRIIAGAQRGRRLVAPAAQSTRPTADRTRQALFDVLVHAPWAPSIVGAQVADLFAGSGALGIEALSRGAARALFVDSAPEAARAIAQNLAAAGLASRGRVLHSAVARVPAPAAEARFDLAFLDPPYGKGLEAPALARLAEGWLAADGVAVVERAAAAAPAAFEGWEVLDERVWGAARVAFLRPIAPA